MKIKLTYHHKSTYRSLIKAFFVSDFSIGVKQFQEILDSTIYIYTYIYIYSHFRIIIHHPLNLQVFFLTIHCVSLVREILEGDDMQEIGVQMRDATRAWNKNIGT